MTMAEKGKRQKVLVAAIDFGTTFSGIAYQFKTTFDSEPTKIWANTKWEGDEHLSQKTVTSILFDEKTKFHSFGYKAETHYSRLMLKKKHMGWYFFKRFKMKLHDAKITRELKLKANNGKEMFAMKVFGESIKYMKGHLLKQLEKEDTQVENDRIHWILTVPAIWSDSAKQFMRESAYEAGIDGSQLTISLEPEAASLYCQVITEQQVSKGQTTNDKNISKIGQKFMVIDLGGGTADITVHKREENGCTTELHPPSGGFFGGTKVDQAFENLLIALIGGEAYKRFFENDPLDVLNLMTAFERSKRTFSPTTDEIMITIPIKLTQYYTEITGEDLDDAIEHTPYNEMVELLGDKLVLSAQMLKEIFNRCASDLVEHVKELMCQDELQGTDIFLMVGGFSESEFMQNEIKRNFPNVKVIIPRDTGLAVVKGAVLYGHNPTSVASRIAKYTYGINISPPFDPNVHPEDHRVSVGNFDRCRDVFKIYIQKGDLIHKEEPKKGKHISLKPNQEEMLLKVYVSKQKHPKFVDDEESEYAGKLVVKLPRKNEKVKVEVRMMFGDTEVAVEAEELETNTKYTAFFDFL